MALSGPLTTHVIKTDSGAVKYSLPRALPDTRQKRPASHGVLVDLGGAVGSYVPMQYIPEARDITLVDGILDRLAAAGPAQYKNEPLATTAAELIRRAGLERELARLEADKELMAREGLTAKDIEALTADEKARLLRKYASPQVNTLIGSLAAQLRPAAVVAAAPPGGAAAPQGVAAAPPPLRSGRPLGRPPGTTNAAMAERRASEAAARGGAAASDSASGYQTRSRGASASAAPERPRS